ncbi:hypothetical protein OG848_14590 [Streptomyces canus]
MANQRTAFASGGASAPSPPASRSAATAWEVITAQGASRATWLSRQKQLQEPSLFCMASSQSRPALTRGSVGPQPAPASASSASAVSSQFGQPDSTDQAQPPGGQPVAMKPASHWQVRIQSIVELSRGSSANPHSCRPAARKVVTENSRSRLTAQEPSGRAVSRR